MAAHGAAGRHQPDELDPSSQAWGSLAVTARVVILNQATNYLTVDLANAFVRSGVDTVLLTGSVHEQDRTLDPRVRVDPIPRWSPSPLRRKWLSYMAALAVAYWKLLVRYRGATVFFVSVPPMGYLLKLVLPHPFALLIWDVYPDLLVVTGRSENSLLYRLWSQLNRLAFRRARRIVTISHGMARLIARYAPGRRITVVPLWAMFERETRLPPNRNRFLVSTGHTQRFIVQYSGNIGETHNVQVLLELARLLVQEPNIVIQIIGRGTRAKGIKDRIEQSGLANISFFEFQADDMFYDSLSAADVGVVILDERIAHGSVPSKTYNLMRLGIPGLYITARGSELERYANKFGCGACFSPDELDQMAHWVLDLFRNHTRREELSRAAKMASRNFTVDNAARIAEAVWVPSDRQS